MVPSHIHILDLTRGPLARGHAARLADALATDDLTVTLHGTTHHEALPGVTVCGCACDSPSSLVRHLRQAIDPHCVVDVHADTDDTARALAALGVLRRLGAHTVLSPHGAPTAGGRARAALLRRRLLLASAVVADTREQAAVLSSLGAETWQSGLLLTPAPDAVAAWRERWGARAVPVVLVAGARLSGDVAAALTSGLPGDARLAVLAGGEAGWPAGAHVTAERPGEDATAAAIAAADVLVVARDDAWGAQLEAAAAQLGTPAVAVDATAASPEAARRVAAAIGAAPGAVDVAAAVRPHRLAYGEAIAPSSLLPEVDGRPRVAVLAWTNAAGRTSEMATALGGEGRLFYDLNITKRKLIPVRYALSSVRTASYLVRRRPQAVIVANPPIIGPLIALAYHKVTRTPMLLDSQTSAFGQKSSRVGQLMLPLSAWISRKSTCTLVGAPELAARVKEWGADAEVFHEAPPVWETVGPPRPGRARRVLWVGIFAEDEPLDALLGAAAALPGVEFRVTGDLRRAPADRETAPPNVTWLGFVRGRAYPQELQDADIVITMTTDPTSALRGAAEAVFAERPLITSDWPFLRGLFPSAVYATNDAAGLTGAVRDALERLPELRDRAREAHNEHLEVWQQQLARLRFWLGEPSPDPSPELDPRLETT